ncbi:unnamed protein product [Adineta ricciae]|uniref:Uncharacterized protein n=1 Tax=Adineta ricciae TaxID=249248 RepID=A0A816CL24_ADIRI|nr:unnamed protein product [Adineta ricciae]CAF1623089.1 unnamed protein product [Adineta ricciae]
MSSKSFVNTFLCLIILFFLFDLILSAKKPDKKCTLPKGRSCTALTPEEMRDKDLGSYFKYPCAGIGCNFYRPYCRLCTKDPNKVNKPYVECPKCVAEVEETFKATDDEYECYMPRDRSCTSLVPSMTKALGLGMYYEYPCYGNGCSYMQPYCRLCVRDPLKNIAPYPKCPSCVP